MAFNNPRGRVNYEPNSWGTGPRETPKGFRSFPAEETGERRRARGELFADHYSQARQFYVSQSEIEQTHIKDAFVFELSKVETPAIRARVVSHLVNVDKTLAQMVADGLGIKLPAAAEPARKPITDLPPSPALSIVKNAPGSFKGRKLGILVSDGADAKLLAALEAAATQQGAMVELIAPKVGGFTASDGKQRPAKQKVNGGPSVLYDAVAVLLSPDGALQLQQEATARDFVADAFAHAKFIAVTKDAAPLLEKAGVEPDGGVMSLGGPKDAERFLELCSQLRFWEREPKVHAV